MRQRVQSSQVFPDLPRTHCLAFSRIDYNHGSQRESGSKVGSATSFLWVHGHPETSLGSSVNRDDSRACITGELNEIMLIPLMLIVFLLSFFIMTLLCVYIFLGSLFSLQIPKEQKLTLSFLYPLTTLNLTWPCEKTEKLTISLCSRSKLLQATIVSNMAQIRLMDTPCGSWPIITRPDRDPPIPFLCLINCELN